MRRKLVTLAIALSLVFGGLVGSAESASAYTNPCSHSMGTTAKHGIGGGFYHSVVKFVSGLKIKATELIYIKVPVPGGYVWAHVDTNYYTCGNAPI